LTTFVASIVTTFVASIVTTFALSINRDREILENDS
jgi:hypothetical protein